MQKETKNGGECHHGAAVAEEEVLLEDNSREQQPFGSQTPVGKDFRSVCR
jgi:hypothetical protein